MHGETAVDHGSLFHSPLLTDQECGGRGDSSVFRFHSFIVAVHDYDKFYFQNIIWVSFSLKTENVGREC